MNNGGDPPAKISRHTLNTYSIRPRIPRDTATTKQLSMLNADKSKTNYDKAIKKYNKFVKSNIPRLLIYKYFTGSHLKPT